MQQLGAVLKLLGAAVPDDDVCVAVSCTCMFVCVFVCACVLLLVKVTAQGQSTILLLMRRGCFPAHYIQKELVVWCKKPMQDMQTRIQARMMFQNCWNFS